MKSMAKLIIRYLCYGISLGCTFFVFTCLFGCLAAGNEFLSPVMADFARQSLGAVLTGIGFGTTAVISQFERPSGLTKLLIHFLIGMGIYYPTAFYLGWIPFYRAKLLYTVLQLLISCGVFFAIWLCFYLFNRNEARKINSKIREFQQDDVT